MRVGRPQASMGVPGGMSYNETVGSDARLYLSPHPVPGIKRALNRATTLRWRAAGRPFRPGLRVLTYHRVSDDPDLLAVSVAEFEAQMRWLVASGFRAVGITEALGMEAPAATVALTFDDGYRDVVEVALPILERHGFRATLYVVPHAVDGMSRFSWYAQMPPLASWDKIALAARAGFEIGAHSLSHPDLTAIDASRCREEITGSSHRIQQALSQPAYSFCYPAGRFGPRERRIVEEAGFRNAVTSDRGVCTPEGDPFTIPRIAIEHRDSLLDFMSKVLGGHDRPLPFTSAYRRVHDRSRNGRRKAPDSA